MGNCRSRRGVDQCGVDQYNWLHRNTPCHARLWSGRGIGEGYTNRNLTAFVRHSSGNSALSPIQGVLRVGLQPTLGCSSLSHHKWSAWSQLQQSHLREPGQPLCIYSPLLLLTLAMWVPGHTRVIIISFRCAAESLIFAFIWFPVVWTREERYKATSITFYRWVYKAALTWIS